MASVAIRDVRKAFGSIEVIHGVDVLIGDGEFVVLVGPSGCGKSTLWMTSIAPKAFLTSRIATEAMDSSRHGLFRAPPLKRARGLFSHCSRTPVPPRRRRAPGLRLEAIIGAISIPRSLQMHPDPRQEIPMSCAKIFAASTLPLQRCVISRHRG